MSLKNFNADTTQLDGDQCQEVKAVRQMEESEKMI